MSILFSITIIFVAVVSLISFALSILFAPVKWVIKKLTPLVIAIGTGFIIYWYFSGAVMF